MSLEDEQVVATVSTPAEKPRVSKDCVMEQLIEQIANGSSEHMPKKPAAQL